MKTFYSIISLIIIWDQLVECDFFNGLDNSDFNNQQSILDNKKSSSNDAVNNSKKLGEWKILFYTGDAIWAGTDSDIYIELIGDFGNSQVTVLKPSKSQLEARSVDTFNLGNLEGKQIGNLKQIIVGKQYSYAFFNDWQLTKIEVFDPQGKKYLFNCNCWFTSNKYKRLISLTSIENLNSNLNESYSISSRSTRVFPMTLALLFLFFILVSFTYFGKIVCNKWRDSLIYFSTLGSNDPNRISRRSQRTGTTDEQDLTNRLMNMANRNRLINGQTNNNDNMEQINLNLYRNQQSTMEDKPPEYTELFPYPTNSNNAKPTNEDNNNINTSQQEQQQHNINVVSANLSSDEPVPQVNSNSNQEPHQSSNISSNQNNQNAENNSNNLIANNNNNNNQTSV